MKRCLVLTLAVMLLLSGGALAEEVFTVSDVAGAASGAGDASYVEASLTTSCSYVSVSCYLDAEAQVTVCVSGPDGGTVYQRDYGLCSGDFRTEDIYLKLQGSETIYQVCLTAGDSAYSFPIRRIMARLKGNAACAVGYPLDALNGQGGWKSVTILDIAAMEGGSMTVPLHASGAYTLGTVTFSVQGGQLTVSAALDGQVDGSIDQADVQVATTALSAQTLDSRQFTGASGTLDMPMDLGGAAYAAVLVRLTVSFDPAGVPASPQVTLDGQDALWQRMLTETPNEAVG